MVPDSTHRDTNTLESYQYRLRFTGSAGEYFRIWIVNLFLTIVTFGIYAAWAKVRTRQYFYANTFLADSPFDYRGNPKAILKGNFIIGSGMLLYMIVSRFSPTYTHGVGLLFYLILPYLVYKSLWFNAQNSAYRNIRFRFLGSLGQSYNTYLFFPILLPLTLGLIYPSWIFRRKRYFFGNFAYGQTANMFSGRVGPVYKYFFFASLIFIGVIIAFGVAAAVFSQLLEGTLPVNTADMGKLLFLIPFISFPILLILYTSVQQFLYAQLNNYCWNLSQLGRLRFKCALRSRKLIWIRISNLLGIIFSIGLLIPWAKVRRARYVLESLTIHTDTRLDEFIAAGEEDVTALGDSATDFFDIEIGL